MLRQSLSILKQLGSAAKSQDATGLLHEDLVLVEQRVEPTKRAAQTLHKKLLGCMQSQSGLEAEKRMKKLPLMLLSISMAESLKDLDGASSIRRVLEMCCFMEKMLATMLADFEMKVEKEVLEPLSKLSEDDLPEILRNKKLFAKLTTDWISAKIRSQTSTGPQTKQDGLREEVEEAWRKLESIKDQYSADLYHFATKEDDYANYFIRLLELQAEHHKNSHAFLDKNISELKESHNRKGLLVSSSSQKVYGEPLLSHLSESEREIAAPIEECIHMLLRTGMREEGLFRLAAAASVVKRLKTCLDQGTVDHSEFNMDPHAVAGALKCYLRELPEPLMTFDLYNDWFKVAGEKDLEEKLKQFRILLKKLPPENYNNLRYLVQFLSLLSEQQAVNKMTPSNIAIVLGPNLLWPQAEGEHVLFDMASASSVQVVTVIEPLIQYSTSLFPEAASFEIPDLFSDVSLDVPPIAAKEEISRSASSSSSASSCSLHLPLLKTNSATSQDNGVSLSVKPGSVNCGGATAQCGLAPKMAASAQPTAAPRSLHCKLTTDQTPTPFQQTTGSHCLPGQSGDQHQDQSEATHISSGPKGSSNKQPPYKPQRCLDRKANRANEMATVEPPEHKAPIPPRPQAPPRPPTNKATALALVKRPAPKKPGIKAPGCPPPLPPPSLAKEVPS